MTRDNYIPLSHAERVKTVADLAAKSGFPVRKVFDIYNNLNNRIYMQNKITALYHPALEEMTFSMTKFILNCLN
jgi:uncharacterized protein (DUF302 family)